MHEETCNGNGRIIWSDDSYATYNEPCGGCSACRGKEKPMISKREKEEVRIDHSAPRVNVTVSIPVSLGGYTGQRDAWEEYERDHKVKVDGEYVILSDAASPGGRQVKFRRDDLDAALKMIAGTKPVYRNHAQGTGA